MKTLGITQLGAIGLLVWAQATSATAVTFQHDNFISFADHSYDGQDIVVTNCTLTVDGTHTFNSVQLLSGAVLTHSAFPYGPQQFTVSVFDEPQTLSAITPAVLGNTNIDADSILVFDSSANILYTEGVDYIVTISNQFTELTLTTNSAIAEGASVLVEYDWEQNFQGVSLTVSNNLQIGTGAAINISGKGYAGGIGFLNGAGTSHSTNYPFLFTAGGGGAHGGSGGMSSTSARGGAAYDSTISPGALGSGGGAGSAGGGGGGGGVVALVVGGNLQVDGQILANGLKGTNAHCGGGAGGSLWISAQSFSGAGGVSANGGSADLPDGGGGGGGRIAIYFGTNNFTGTISAFGGNGATAGGAGTIYLQSIADTAGQLVIVNGGKRGTNTTFSAAVNDLTISGGAIAQPQSSVLYVTNLFVGSNSWLIPLDGPALVLSVNGNATMESNAAINADFRSTSGLGAGSEACGAGSGGSYGGYGGASVCGTPGGAVYGSVIFPVNLGSPGGSKPLAPGGGAINMTVAGTLSLAGNISANGAPASGSTNGGGSGGSVRLTVGTLTGGGTISANGGPANNLVGGGGGGGRVAVYFNTNLFTGNFAAHGGPGTNAGGAGTVYLQLSNSIAQLVVDNGGVAGATSLGSLTGQYDLQISGGAVLTNTAGAISVRNLFISSNSWLTTTAFLLQGYSVVAASATIQSNGGIMVDGGSSASVGSGTSANGTGGGGGNGGNGGNGATNALGGTVAGSIMQPATPGGMGGVGANGLGGKGGGAINLTVQNTLQLDGKISANGITGPGFNSGGGAGGSILVSARTISGAGTISANGGAANDTGGGGGGGRVAVYYTTNLFSGSFTAYGGAGANYGGAGTVFAARVTGGQVTLPFPAIPPFPQVIVDNGGNRGAITPLSFVTGAYDLTVTGRAALSNTVSGTLQLGSLLVGSNSTFQTYSFSQQQQIVVSSNATILAGGSVNADGVSQGSQGNGQTLNLTGGGGANAGSGGASVLNALGGNPFSDSITLPVSIGSRGGSGFNGGSGGNGGGSLKMTVTGTLRVDGRISADGAASPTLNGGGGAGGTVSLSAKLLSGSGAISTSGGAGNAGGGGGGGGHIAISYSANLFAGNLIARSGSGANFGGAGIIYTASSPDFTGLGPQLILDNGGTQGGYTTIFTSLQNVSLTVTGAAILTNASGPFTLNSLFMGSNSTWLASPSRSILTVLSNATIQASAKITADGLVTGGGLSQGQTLFSTGGGGGHGGYGGASVSNALGGNISTDSVSEPGSNPGQGGFGGGNAGAALQFSVRGTMQLDGRISADGVTSSNLNSGGGAGGSVSLTVGKLLGAGSISANGGAGNNGGGGGGGGGRIAISYNTNQFAGGFTARGGSGANSGGAGTIYLNSNFFGQGKSSQLIVDNGGMRGTNTLVTFVAGTAGQNFVIGNGASVILSPGGIPGGSTAWNSLTISSNGSLSGDSLLGTMTVTITSNLTVQTGGVFALDGQGSGPNAGTGHGGIGGGAGHGGYGSMGNQATATGGTSYDSISAPTLTGSGGGSSSTNGSAGGGALHLTVNGIMTINGILSVNGKPGVVSGAGGGSGGSLWLNVGTISGAGRISADGGNGEIFGGGGGGAGGRIAIYFNTNQFTGKLSARGGAGPILAGGAGTVSWKTNSSNIAQLILDDGGAPGANTPLDSLTQTPITLSLSNGAAASSAVPLTLQDLSVGPGGFFNANPMASLRLTVLGNASIAAGGEINADASADGEIVPGFGTVDSYGDGSGGGYGGAGGASFFGAPGGGTYGSSNQPIDFGAAGGSLPQLPDFSQGGGVIRLNVSGALSVAGSISANGGDGIIDGSGGGSGGSIWINAQSFSGSGAVTVNGGMGESSEGGGGGGGRIAIYAGTNLFSGGIFASGGEGAFPGQDGTIYILTNLLVSGNIIGANGAAISGMSVQPNGLPAITTDINGFYSVIVPPAWTGTITPSGSNLFVPSSRTYSNLASNVPNQNYLVASPSDFNLSGGQFDGSNVNFNWFGIQGVHYQPLYSTNLVDWMPYGPPIIGSNAPVVLAMPTTNAPLMYFRFGVSY
jgi:hypothetical protein